jgi:hypothetical protein
MAEEENSPILTLEGNNWLCSKCQKAYLYDEWLKASICCKKEDKKKRGD